MKFLKFSLILSFLALFVFACSQAPPANNAAVKTNAPVNVPTETPDELAAARTIYTEKCVKCHKEDGTGGTVEVLGEKHKAANFTSDALKKDPDSELIEAIEDGVDGEGMPAFKGKLTDEQIRGLVKFIRTEFQGK